MLYFVTILNLSLFLDFALHSHSENVIKKELGQNRCGGSLVIMRFGKKIVFDWLSHRRLSFFSAPPVYLPQFYSRVFSTTVMEAVDSFKRSVFLCQVHGVACHKNVFLIVTVLLTSRFLAVVRGYGVLRRTFSGRVPRQIEHVMHACFPHCSQLDGPQ